MEAGAAQLAAAHHSRVFPPWESLPLDVLGLCLRSGPGPQEHAPFAICKSCARAVLFSAKKPSLAVDVDHFEPAVARVLRWTTEWDVDLGLRLRAAAEVAQPPPSLQPVLRLLQQECTGLPNVSRVWCEGVPLDACAPAGLEAVFPNLKQLTVRDCRLTAGTLPLASCSNLQQLDLGASRNCSQADWLPQLQQLTASPSLSAITLNSIHEYPTSFLPLLAGQLTHLCLFNHRGFQQWLKPALEAAAQLSQLQTLTLSGSSITAQHLGVLTRLSQLQTLQLPSIAAEADQLLSSVLQFPHLTRLQLDELSGLQGSYTEQPCTWKQLKLLSATPQVLAKLPLHSLTHPLQLDSLILATTTTAADVQAAVDNLAGSAAPTACSWGTEGSLIMQASLNTQSSSQAASELLCAAAPLVPQGIVSADVEHACMDADLLLALQQAVPATVTTLNLSDCIIQHSFWPQLARSFPQLELLSVSTPRRQRLQCGAADLLGYFCAAASAQQQPGMPRAARVQLSLSINEINMSEYSWDMDETRAIVLHHISTQQQEMEVVDGHLRQVGFRTPGGSPTTVQVEFPGAADYEASSEDIMSSDADS